MPPLQKDAVKKIEDEFLWYLSMHKRIRHESSNYGTI